MHTHTHLRFWKNFQTNLLQFFFVGRFEMNNKSKKNRFPFYHLSRIQNEKIFHNLIYLLYLTFILQ